MFRLNRLLLEFMKCTRKKPSVEGRYWFRAWGKTKIVTIAHHPDAEIDAWRVCVEHFNEYGTAMALFPEKECEWSDAPIPMPV